MPLVFPDHEWPRSSMRGHLKVPLEDSQVHLERRRRISPTASRMAKEERGTAVCPRSQGYGLGFEVIPLSRLARARGGSPASGGSFRHFSVSRGNAMK